MFSPFFAATVFTTSMICACGPPVTPTLIVSSACAAVVANSEAAPSAAASLRMKRRCMVDLSKSMSGVLSVSHLLLVTQTTHEPISKRLHELHEHDQNQHDRQNHFRQEAL